MWRTYSSRSVLRYACLPQLVPTANVTAASVLPPVIAACRSDEPVATDTTTDTTDPTDTSTAAAASTTRTTRTTTRPPKRRPRRGCLRTNLRGFLPGPT